MRCQAGTKRKKFKQVSYKLNVLCFVDLEQREDAARVNKENDEMAAKHLQAEVS